jgi:hypothetical protein
MGKRLLGSILVTGVILGASGVHSVPASAATHDLSVLIEGKPYSLSQTIHNNRTYVPIRSLQDGFNADIVYDAKTRTVKVTRGDTEITIDLNTNAVMVNGVEQKNIPAPYLDTKTNRVMVPLKAFAELFDHDVTWDDSKRVVSISPSQQLTDQEKKIKSILDAEKQASAEKNAVHMSAQMQMVMKGLNALPDNKDNPAPPVQMPSEISINGKFTGDATAKPFAMHLKGQMSVPMGLLGQSLDLEMYMKDGVIYLNDPMTHKWEKLKFMDEAEWNQLINTMNTSASAQNDQVTDLLLPFMRLTDDNSNNEYIVNMYLNNTLFNKLQEISSQLNPGMAKVNQPSDVGTPDLKKMVMRIGIDKTTYLEKEGRFEMSMGGPNGETMDLSMDMQIDYDHVGSVAIPDDVLKNAQDLNSAGNMPVMPMPPVTQNPASGK